jgi:CheY-like chemotaxis protein
VSERQLIGKSPRILVVDDNDDNRYTLTLYLEPKATQYPIRA